MKVAHLALMTLMATTMLIQNIASAAAPVSYTAPVKSYFEQALKNDSKKDKDGKIATIPTIDFKEKGVRYLLSGKALGMTSYKCKVTIITDQDETIKKGYGQVCLENSGLVDDGESSYYVEISEVRVALGEKYLEKMDASQLACMTHQLEELDKAKSNQNSAAANFLKKFSPAIAIKLVTMPNLTPFQQSEVYQSHENLHPEVEGDSSYISFTVFKDSKGCHYLNAGMINEKLAKSAYFPGFSKNIDGLAEFKSELKKLNSEKKLKEKINILEDSSRQSIKPTESNAVSTPEKKTFDR
jgi:hypothetical protein